MNENVLRKISANKIQKYSEGVVYLNQVGFFPQECKVNLTFENQCNLPY